VPCHDCPHALSFDATTLDVNELHENGADVGFGNVPGVTQSNQGLNRRAYGMHSLKRPVVTLPLATPSRLGRPRDTSIGG
jgi:hypothetical protein